MNARRQKLHTWIALQSSAAAAGAAAGEHPISEIAAYALREPSSGRKYTVVRVRTRSGLTGYGESGTLQAGDIRQSAQHADGKPATAYQVLRSGTSLDGGINMALLDITAKACSAPVYRLLGGPTRVKARGLARLTGENDNELSASLDEQKRAGFKAFQVPLPRAHRTQSGTSFRQGSALAYGSPSKSRGRRRRFRARWRG